MFCSKCGQENPNNSKFCSACGQPIEISVVPTKEYSMEELEIAYYKSNLQMQQNALNAQKQQLEIQQKQYESIAKCPKCGSTSLSGNKKGFGIGKAVVGAAVIGPLGLVAGNINAKKVIVTCLNCGKKFKIKGRLV